MPRILQAVRDAELPTLLVGTAALRALKGPEVTLALVKAYPELPPRLQKALIPVLGSREDPSTLAILEREARSGDPGLRAAALEAIDEAGRSKGKKVEGMAAAGSSKDLAGAAGTVSRWWVVGPFDLGEKDQGWETRFIGEPDVSTVARYMSGKTRVQWKPVRSQDPHGKIDLRSAIAGRDHCVGYAYAEIYARSAGRRRAPGRGRRQREDLGERREGLRALHLARTPARPGPRPRQAEGRHERDPAQALPGHPGLGVLRRIVTADGRPLAFAQKGD